MVGGHEMQEAEDEQTLSQEGDNKADGWNQNYCSIFNMLSNRIH